MPITDERNPMRELIRYNDEGLLKEFIRRKR